MPVDGLPVLCHIIALWTFSVPGSHLVQIFVHLFLEVTVEQVVLQLAALVLGRGLEATNLARKLPGDFKGTPGDFSAYRGDRFGTNG